MRAEDNGRVLGYDNSTAITIGRKRMERFLNEMRRLRYKKEPV